jgi:hypothetical protein
MRRAVLVGIAVVACKSEPSKEETDKAKMAAIAKKVAIGPYIDLTPSELVNSYRVNSVAADENYKGKVLRILGVVDRVTQDREGVPLVVIRDLNGDRASERMTITCGWNGDRTVVASYLPGTKVVLNGVGAGIAMGGPLLLFCDKDKNPVPETKLEAGDLTNDPSYWRSKLEMFLRGKDTKKFKVTYSGATENEVTIETQTCDRAKLGVEQLGSIPHGFKVSCVTNKAVQWTLQNN